MLMLHEITAGYDHYPVLHGVSLRVPSATLVALVGLPQSGKSSVIGAAAGRLVATAGRVLLDAEELTRLPAYLIARHGLHRIPRHRSLCPRLTVRDHLLMYAPGGDIGALLDLAAATHPQLGARSNQPVSGLHAGERLALALCQARAARARYVLVDDALDEVPPEDVPAAWAALDTLRANGIGVLLTGAHNAELPAADTVYRIEAGHVEIPSQPVLDAAPCGV